MRQKRTEQEISAGFVQYAGRMVETTVTRYQKIPMLMLL